MTNPTHRVIAQPYGEAVTLTASAARTSNGSGGGVYIGHLSRLQVLLSITASATDAGDTLDVYVDVSPDGSTWLNAVHFTQQAGNGAAVKQTATLDRANPGTSVIAVTSDAAAGSVRPALWGLYARARWAIADSGNGNSSHTFAVTACGQ